MARRLLTWSGTVVVAAGTYLGVKMLGASAVVQAPSAAQMRDVAPATPTVGGWDNAPLSSPGGAPRSMAPLTGVELYTQVNDEFPNGPQTWSAIDRAVSRAITAHQRVAGSLAAACAADGALDDLPVRVQWDVATREDVQVAGGRIVDEGVDESYRACADRYLAGITGSYPSKDPLVELDIRFEMPISAGRAR